MEDCSHLVLQRLLEVRKMLVKAYGCCGDADVRARWELEGNVRLA